MDYVILFGIDKNVNRCGVIYKKLENAIAQATGTDKIVKTLNGAKILDAYEPLRDVLLEKVPERYQTSEAMTRVWEKDQQWKVSVLQEQLDLLIAEGGTEIVEVKV